MLTSYVCGYMHSQQNTLTPCNKPPAIRCLSCINNFNGVCLEWRFVQ